MIINTFLIFLITLMPIINSDMIHYEEASNDYSVDIYKTMKVVRQILPNGYLDKFSYYENNKLCYAISIGKARNTGGMSDMSYEKNYQAFVEGYTNSCSCEVLNSKKRSYKNLSGVEFKTKMKNGVINQTFNTGSGKNSYAIIFVVQEENYDKYISTYTAILNSIEIYK